MPSFNQEGYYVDQSATLSGCQFVSNFTKSLSVSWLKNGNVVNDRTSFTSVWTGSAHLITVSSLTLSNLKNSDSGDYSCRLSYTDTTRRNVDSAVKNLAVQSKFFFDYKETYVVCANTLMSVLNFVRWHSILSNESLHNFSCGCFFNFVNYWSASLKKVTYYLVIKIKISKKVIGMENLTCYLTCYYPIFLNNGMCICYT